MPARSEPTRTLSAVSTLLLAAAPAAAQTNRTGSGSNYNRSEPGNRFISGPPNTLPPGGGDGVSFRPQ